MVEEVTPGTKDGRGGGDRDTPFTWGHPLFCLTHLQASRCLVMRGLVRDASHAPDSIRDQLKYGADSDLPRRTTAGGVLIPQDLWFGLSDYMVEVVP